MIRYFLIIFIITNGLIDICCGCGSSPPSPPVNPCDTSAKDCMEFGRYNKLTYPADHPKSGQDYLGCCGLAINSRHWTITNRSPRDVIFVITMWEKNTDISSWVRKPHYGSEYPLFYLKPGDQYTRMLECESTIDSTSSIYCNTWREYRVESGCFVGEGNCTQPTLPDNTGLPPNDCISAFNGKKTNCGNIPFNLLGPEQRSAVIALRRALQNEPMPYTLPRQVFEQAFFPNVAGCQGRTSTIQASLLHSVGSDCKQWGQLPNPVELANTGLYYNQVWLRIPAVMRGTLFRGIGSATMDMDDARQESVWFTVKLNDAPPGKDGKVDILDKIYALGAPDDFGTLVLSGRDFVCLAVTDIPKIVERAR